MSKPVATLTQFQADFPFANLVLLDTNFASLFAVANDALTYSNYLVDSSSTPNTINASFSAGISCTLTAGLLLQVKIANTNTGSCSINVNSLGLIPIVNPDGSTMSPGQLLVGGVYQFQHNGTSFILLGSWVSPSLVISAAEVAAGVTPTNYAYAPGNVLRYGANTTPGTTDMTAAIQAAVNVAGAGGGNVYIPPGIYKISSAISYTMLSTTLALTIQGAGSEVTIIKQTAAANGLSIALDGPYCCVHIRDICFTTTQTNSGSAISLSQRAATIANPANTALSDITNVTCRGADGYVVSECWAIGVQISGISDVTYDGLVVVSNGAIAGIGVSLVATSTANSVVHNFIDCQLNFCQYGIEYGSYVQGITVSGGCNFTGSNYGVISPPGSVGTDQLSISNSQFECTQAGVLIQAALPNVQVSDSLFIVGLNNNAVGIQLIVSGYGSITGCTFNPIGGATGISAIQVTGTGSGQTTSIAGNMIFGMSLDGINITGTAANVNVTGNTITGCSSGIANAANNVDIVGNTVINSTTGAATGIGNSGNNVNIQANTLTNCTTPIGNSGTGCVIANNPGYNPVGISGGHVVGASPATITNGASPATYYFSQSATFTGTVTIGAGGLIGTLTSGNVVIWNAGPNESCTVTWTTTAPTYLLSVH